MILEKTRAAGRWGPWVPQGTLASLLALLLTAGVLAALFVLQRFTVLGTILIVSGIVMALGASLSYALATRGIIRALAWGRRGVRATLGAVVLLLALLIYLFVARRYDIAYVYDYSSNDLPLHYRIASLWAGQPGSFGVWVVWGAIVAQFLIRRTREAEPYILSVFMLIPASLLLFMLILNPFVPYYDATGIALAPVDGHGLNPLLQNPWMVIHTAGAVSELHAAGGGVRLCS